MINACVYVGIAVLTAFSTQMGTDEAAKYVEPAALFWIKIATGCLTMGLLAFKTYLSDPNAALKTKIEPKDKS